jgi:hypothetical protein
MKKNKNLSTEKYRKQLIIGASALTMLMFAAAVYILLTDNKAKEVVEAMDLNISQSGTSYMSDIVIYTKETDPDGLLGKDNQYVAKASFCDERIENADGEYIGVIEVFDSLDVLELRKYYIESVAQVSVGVYEKYGSYGQYSLMDQAEIISEKNALLILYASVPDETAIGEYKSAFKQAMEKVEFKDKDSMTDDELAAEKSKIRMQVQVIVSEVATELGESLYELHEEIESAVCRAEETLSPDDLAAAQELADNAHEDYFSEVKDWKARLDKVEEKIKAGEKGGE